MMYDDKLEVIRQRIEKSKVYYVNDYVYFVYPYKGIEPLEITELSVSSEMVLKLLPPPDDFDVILTFMTDGIIISLPIAIKLHKKLWVARDYHYKACDIEFNQITGYNSRKLFLNASWINKTYNPVRVVIVDAVISTGGTIINCINSLSEKYKGKIVWIGAYALISKSQYGGCKKIRDTLNIPCKAVFGVYYNGKLKCVSPV